nr:FKBP-type peptidyl-prolyl cis-trans isomerase [Sphingomonas sp.]
MAALFTAVSMFRASPAAASAFLAKNRHAEGVRETASGLQYKVLMAGAGARPTDADVAVVTYRGTLVDGTAFDESRRPVPMPVAGVIPGFAEGLKLMQTGARYRLWIGPDLGYGSRATGPIPAHSVLVFDVDLVAVQRATPNLEGRPR